jgi:[acyl-carrier-protein] S-malonyltransferase
MAKEFIESSARYGEILSMAEEICNLPLGRLIDEGPMEELTLNANLQPAITLTNLICWEAAKEALDPGRIKCFAGHSLGEYSALHGAGVISKEDCLKLVAKRGALMQREGTANPGGMRAVVGLSIEQVEEIIDGYQGEGVVTAANHNTPQQVVISGSLDGLDAVSPNMEEKGGKVIALNVSVANHSPLVAAAAEEFGEFMAGIEFKAPSVPVYFNVSGSIENDPAVIKEMMARQIASRVRWCDIISSMIDDEVKTFIEVGPKTVLKGMMRKITPKGVKVTSLQCDSPSTLASVIEKTS